MSEPDEPQKFGRYSVVRTLGKGAMGIVYLGEDPVISRRVAIKVIRSHPDLEDTELEERQARFEREFRSAGNLSHPNIVTVYDVGKEANDSYITMEYVQGESLGSVLDSGRSFSLREVSDIALQLAAALDYAHAQGIVHRDIKPANILMTVDGRPKITDFGVAKLQTSGMTSTGMIIGTPMYMSPEQITGREVSGASDQFSLAAMLYELMTGEPPFQGDNPTTIMYQVVHNEPESPHALNKSLPAGVDRAVLRGMAKKVADRYPSCRALAEAIDRALGGGALDEGRRDETYSEMETVALRPDEIVLEDKPAPTRGASAEARRRPWLPAAAAALVVAGIAGWAVMSRRGSDATGGLPPPGEISASLEVVSDPPGAQIFVDGEDRGLATPAFVTLAGAAGDVREIELRRDGATLARTQMVMGSAVPTQWAPSLPPSPERWTVSSSPSGATVSVDGAPAGTTPTDFVFAYGQSYEVRYELEGYEPVSRTVDLAAMDPSARARRTLDAPLAQQVVPGTLVVEAPYAVAVSIDGRRQPGSRVSLPPGSYNVGLAAPEVFYFADRRVDIRGGQATELALPAATPVTIAATPSNCKIRIDGRDAGFVPLNLQLSIGRHEIEFLWETLGRTLTVTEDVGTSTERIFRAAPPQ